MVFIKSLFRVLLLSIMFIIFGCAPKITALKLEEELRNCQLNLGETDLTHTLTIKKIDSLIHTNMALENQNNSIVSEITMLENNLKEEEQVILEMNENYQRLYSSQDSLRGLNRELHLLNSNLSKEISLQQKMLDSAMSNKDESKINFSLSEGRVAFYCPKEMEYQRPYSVVGLIADVISNEEAKLLLINKIKTLDETVDVNKLQNDSILVRQIQYYNLVELSLDKAKNKGFEIKKIHTSDKQRVEANMEGWHWEVTPIDTEPHQKLILTVFYLDENNVSNYKLSKSYNIKVKIKSSRFFANLRTRFIEDTEWTIGTIVIPFLTFLYGKRRKKKEEESKED